MKIKAQYATQEEVPADYVDLYEEKDGKWVLTQVEGVRSEEEFTRVHGALTKERNDHRETKGKISLLGGRDINEVVADLDKIEEYKIAADAGKDEHKVEKLVESRLRTKIAPIERERDQLKTRVGELETEVTGFKTETRTRSIRDALSSAATKTKVIQEAQEDVVMLGVNLFELDDNGIVVTRDNIPGVTPGITPEAWLSDNVSKKPHWFGSSFGGGAGGSRGNGGGGANPWKHDQWNMTQQGEMLRTDRQKAEQLAKAAGTTIGGPRPAASK